MYFFFVYYMINNLIHLKIDVKLDNLTRIFMSAVYKVGVTYHLGREFGPDLTGKADTFTLKYKLQGSSDDWTVVDADFTEVIDGSYTVPVSFDTKGSYVIAIESSEDGIETLTGNVIVNNANIDDVKAAVDNARVVIDQIAEDVDGLNGATMDELKEQLAYIRQLSEDTKDVKIWIDGDETAKISEGVVLTGDTSGATGKVSAVDYNGDQTVVLMHNVEGTFENDETVNNGDESTDGKIVKNEINTVNSIIEYVEAINNAVSEGNTGLSALKGYTDDIENMLLGTEKLANGDDNPFYDEDFPGAAKNKDLHDGFADLKSSMDDAKASIEDKIANARQDVLDATDAIKSVVDGNKDKLEDDGYGLEALKNLIDGVSTKVTDTTDDIKDILNDADNGLKAVKDAIMDKLNSMDGKLDDIKAATASRMIL